RVRHNPVSSILAVLTALPGGSNAFCNVTGIDPKNLWQGIDLMSYGQLFAASFNAFCSLGMNIPQLTWFYMGVGMDIEKSKKLFHQGKTGKLILFLALLTGISAALAAGSIS